MLCMLATLGAKQVAGLPKIQPSSNTVPIEDAPSSQSRAQITSTEGGTSPSDSTQMTPTRHVPEEHPFLAVQGALKDHPLSTLVLG